MYFKILIIKLKQRLFSRRFFNANTKPEIFFAVFAKKYYLHPDQNMCYGVLPAYFAPPMSNFPLLFKIWFSQKFFRL